MIALGYSRKIYESAEQILAERRKKAEDTAAQRKAAFYGICPEAAEIESVLSRTAIAAARAVLGGGSAREQLTRLKAQNLALQSQLKEKLNSFGYDEHYLEPEYACRLCGDTGYVDGRMCECMKKLLRAQAYDSLNALTPLKLSTFESFSLDFYPDKAEGDTARSPRSIMEGVYRNCRRYADSFSPSSPSLMMQGATGLGKTHLSLAIANAAIQKGFGVVYCSVNNMITKLEREHFGRDEGNTGSMILDCDLLILDDLGTEFRTAFSCAEIYNIVNTRLMTQKPTIISTNLSIQELQERYTERFASRIMGDYVRVLFSGRDNRLQKLLRSQC
ncbi:ATP-binding protein [Caproiciproducens sp. R2]|uniref:ATP-binding protein n=1 Tax=Caproiciproducens sp. R2 TaxID=3435187 RepID=UPI00403487F9